jgi:gamma-glutamyl-gamma-aminobutyrate hydrolase PuuD
MIEPIKYSIPFVMPDKEKLEEYNEYLYNLDELIISKSTELEQKMYDYIQKNSDKKRMVL